MKRLAMICLISMLFAVWAQAVVAASPCGSCDSYSPFDEAKRMTEVKDKKALTNAIREAYSKRYYRDMLQRLREEGLRVLADESRLIVSPEGIMALMVGVTNETTRGFVYYVIQPDGPSAVAAILTDLKKIRVIWGDEKGIQASESDVDFASLGVTTSSLTPCESYCFVLAVSGCWAACMPLTGWNSWLCNILCSGTTLAMCNCVCGGYCPGNPPPDCGLWPLPDCE